MRALWAEPHVVFEGKDHTIPDAGINPLPAKPLEIWIGGSADKTYNRIGRLGDGWLNSHIPLDNVGPALDKIRAGAEQAGRDPSTIGLQCWVSMVGGTPETWRADIEAWRAQGATHLALNTVEGSDAATHLKAIETYMAAVKDLF